MTVGLYFFFSSTAAPFLFLSYLGSSNIKKKIVGALCLLTFIFSLVLTQETKKKIQEVQHTTLLPHSQQPTNSLVRLCWCFSHAHEG
jgi:hypothetical protein